MPCCAISIPPRPPSMVEDGVARIQAAGADLVLVDPQYSPRVTEHAESAEPDGQAARQGRRTAPCRHFPPLRGDARMARAAGPADRQFRHRRRPAHERLGLCLLRPIARRRHHQVGRPDQARRQRAAATCRPTGRCEGCERRVANSDSWLRSPLAMSPHAFSSAACRSSIRSSRCSSPAEKRIKPSLMPSSARASGVSR